MAASKASVFYEVALSPIEIIQGKHRCRVVACPTSVSKAKGKVSPQK